MTYMHEQDLLFQQGSSPAEDGVPEPRFSVNTDDGMLIERNQAVSLTDGTVIYLDVFRPEGEQDVPALIAWGPYGKHNGGAVYQQFKDESGNQGGGVKPEWLSAYTTFEGPDPRQWCDNRYAVINVDPRATWWSAGDYATFWDEREAHDTVDVIAWAGTQPWCNGKVGMSGVSYLAVAQWWAASLRPPYLAAINPCEGLSDVYREFAFHGGIPSNFPTFWLKHRLKYSTTKVEAIADMMVDHPLDDSYWDTKRPDLSKIDVPAYVIASWSDQGLHTRGTLAAFEQISSPHRYLEVHGRKKWEYYHQPSTVNRQRQFFDRYLKDIDNGVDDWPPIRLETRISSYHGVERTPTAWPPPETTFRRLFLDAGAHTLTEQAPQVEATARYEAGKDSADDTSFDYTFTSPVDVIGGMKLRLWVEADGSDDMDMYVAIKKIDRDGNTVDFPFANVLEQGPTALGWLRVSHRSVDSDRSSDNRPWHTHLREDKLSAGQIVDVDIEIWPSGTRFEAGEGLRLLLRGSDFYTGAVMSRHLETRNNGNHLLHTGGSKYDSFLVIPMLPVEPSSTDWPADD
jgi:predicted acyl esterase